MKKQVKRRIVTKLAPVLNDKPLKRVSGAVVANKEKFSRAR
jgi:hypothetical protein